MPPFPLRTRLGQIRATVRDSGPRAVAVKALQELRLYRRLVLFEVPLDPCPPREDPASAGAEVRELSASEADLASYAALRPDASRGEARDRLRRGDRCFVAALEGHLVSSVWVATGVVTVDYLECEVELAPRQAYVYDAYTVPSLRGLDVGSWRTELMKERMRAEGCRRLVSLQLPENRSQNRRAERRGYPRLGVVGWYGIGRWRRFFVHGRDGTPGAETIQVRGSSASARGAARHGLRSTPWRAL